jgi:hypothetical protein
MLVVPFAQFLQVLALVLSLALLAGCGRWLRSDGAL